MLRPRTIIWGALLGLAFFAAASYTHAGAAGQANPVPAPCCTTAPEWYVNPDETDLKPTQQPFGLLFDGPSLIHHAVAPVGLADAPNDGAFGGHLFHGSMPLFKMETTLPYSTINKTSGGYWSSKITTGAGSQSMPLASLADFVGKATSNGGYTADTKVYSFGVGYAHDTGNKALVSWISFGGHKYNLACPKPTPSASSPSPSTSPSVTPTVVPTTPGATTQPPPTTEAPPTPDSTPTAPATPGTTPTDIFGGGGTGGTGTGGHLAKTGYNLAIPIGIGVSSILAGVFLLVMLYLRRRRTFVA